MSDVAQDVNQEEITSTESSTENQSQEVAQEETQETPEVKAVPYERFSQVINNKKELEGKVAQLEKQLEALQSPTKETNPQEELVKQQLDKYLKDLGYVSKKELEEKEQDQKLEQTMLSLEKKYNGADGRPKFERSKILDFASKNLIGNLEVAYKQMHEAELMDFAIKQAMGKGKGVKSEVSDGSGSSQMGTTQQDLLNQAAKGDSSAIQTLIKRTL